jgi:hypothetical protein
VKWENSDFVPVYGLAAARQPLRLAPKGTLPTAHLHKGRQGLASYGLFGPSTAVFVVRCGQNIWES